MKKFIAITITLSLILSSMMIFDGAFVNNTTVDVVSAATNTTPTTPTTPSTTKPTTTKPTTPAKPTTTKPATPAVPVVKIPTYQDGIFVAYGNAYSKGTEGAKVTLKDGKITAVELLRTSPKLIDRDARSNYQGLWQAYDIMAKKLVGKTREEAAKVDAVTGATRSSEGWKLSVDRAFQRALSVKPTNQTYFEGEHMGVDPQGKFMVFAKYDKTKLSGIKVYPLNATGDAIEETTMTAEQAKTTYTLANELLYNGLNAKPIKGYEADTTAVVKALWDAEQNAKLDNNTKYIDGFYSSYGTARDKGVERVDIYIRNDKLVDVKLYRLGSNLIDRGTTAYKEVVAANAPMVAKLLEHGTYIENIDPKVDVVSGASESIHSWNEAVERAFEKALKVPADKNLYFDGRFAGVDNKSKLLVIADIKNNVQTSVKTYLFDDAMKLIAEDKLTTEQKDMLAKLDSGLLKLNRKMPDIVGYEAYSAIARAAYTDMLNNASKKQGAYKDGLFTAYGEATKNGSNRADVTLRNGNIVDLKLYRVGINLADRGNSAYPAVIKAIPELIKNFFAAITRDNVKKVDAVTGATSSSNEFKLAIDRAYSKAEIVESPKAAYFNGVTAGVDKTGTVYVMVTVQNGIPTQMVVNYIDVAGKLKPVEAYEPYEKAVKDEIEASNGTTLHKYGYRPAAFGKTEEEKALSAKVVEAIKAALESAGK